jgi:MFS family permease
MASTTPMFVAAMVVLTAMGSGINLFAPHWQELSKDFGLGEGERDLYLGGYMASAFFLVGAPSSVVIGTIADQSSRKRLVLGLVALAALATGGSALASSIGELLLWRVVLGCAVGGIGPVVYSMFGDLYLPAERSAVAGGAGIALGGGTAVAQILAANVHWRSACAISSGYTLVALLVFYALSSEPARTGAEGAAIDSFSALVTQFRRVVQVPSNRLLLSQSLFGTLPWAVVNTFLPDYLAREKGQTKSAATLLVVLFGAGAAIGGIAGGMLGRYVYRRFGPSAVPLLCAPIQAAAALPMIAILHMPHASELAENKSLQALINAGALVAGVLSSVTGPNLRSIFLNVNRPDMRAKVFSVGYLVDSVSKGLGPWLIGQLAAFYAAGAVSGAGDEGGRAWLFSLAVCGWLVSGSIIYFASGTVTNDERTATVVAARSTKE